MQKRFVILLICLVGGTVVAQNTPSAPNPLRYDVVSVRENKSGAYTSSVRFENGDLLQAQNSNLMLIVCRGYDLPQYLVEGLPDWGLSQHFDVTGKILDASPEQLTKLTSSQRRAMLIEVLKDRFSLKAHWETREKPEYALVVAKSGSKLKESQAQQPMNDFGWRSMDAKRIGTEDLAKDLQELVNKPVLDKRGLAGKYDIKFMWSVEGQSLNGSEVKDETPNSAIFKSIQDSLGLELKPIRGPVQVLIVNSLSHPSPN